MQNDDETVGQLLTRREALAVLGLSGSALFAPGLGAPPGPRSRVPACVVRPEQTEGPYFVDEALQRSDIRSDPGSGVVSPGAPLLLTFALSRVGAQACTPLPGAHVDVWQCDALGVYSDVEDPNFDTRGKRYLRGYQLTDTQGLARFVTIYPGWYPQRAVHIHFKVRTAPAARAGYSFTSQVYFDERLTDRVHAQAPYTNRQGTRRRNADDSIYRQGGDQLVLDVTRAGSQYETVFPVGLQIP
jgi:protocatechuate 3,4-dioxygenase beta subunit